MRDVANVSVNLQTMVNLYKCSIFAMTPTIWHPTVKIRSNQTVCNNNTDFQKELFSRFCTVEVFLARLPGLGDACQSGDTVEGNKIPVKNLVSVYHVKYYDYTVKWCRGVCN